MSPPATAAPVRPDAAPPRRPPEAGAEPRPATGPAPAPAPAPVGNEHLPPADEVVLTPISHDGLLVSEEDYWQHYYPGHDPVYEWNNGRLEEKPVSDYGTFLVYEWLLNLLGRYLKACPIARGVALDMGFRIPLPDGVRIRRPDYGVVRNDNPQKLLPLDASYHGIYDLCIEALADKKRTDQERDQVTKKAEYAAGGVTEYWILHQEADNPAFWCRGEDGGYQPIAPVDGVVHSVVLPGFRFRLTDLLNQPDLDGLREDPLYADFLYPDWCAAEAEAAAARRAAETELAALREALAQRQADGT